MPIWKLLHILVMFAAVTLFFGGNILLHRVVASGHVPTIRRFIGLVDPLFRGGLGLLTLGVVLGLVTAATGGWSLLATWLVIGYVLVAAIYLVGFVIGVPWYRGVGVAAAASSDDDPVPSPALRAAIADRRGRLDLGLSTALYIAVIAVMVLKPG
jgi:hypothetical protein